jgi:Nif-specific regulatory protein
MEHNWPGNIRELEHSIERAVLLARDQIQRQDLPTEVSNNPQSFPKTMEPMGLQERLKKVERDMIVQALQKNSWIQSRAAKELSLSRANLNQRIKRLGITIPK